MLRLARFIGFLAPLAVAGTVIAVSGMMNVSGPTDRTLLFPLMALAAVAGMTSMALFAWSYMGFRLNRIAAALETTLESDQPTLLRENGVPAERRLARAFNAASGAFLQVEARATHDRLTGVPNRESLLGTLVAEIERAHRHHKPLSVAFIDIDRFKPINDTHGHNSGDAVLRQVASLIADNIRASDLFGRYGGEEFMLILPETGVEEAVVLAEELRSLVMSARLRIARSQTLQVTISIGVAGGVGHELQTDTLVDQADAAMYAAKSLGRNRTYLYRDLDEDAPVRRSPIGADRRAAATAIGQWASDTATQALASVLAPQPHHRGRPSDMISSLATGIGLEMGLPTEEIERIRIAALLHDLGKLAVPPEILDKPTKLTDGEWQAIGEHPRIGQVILEQASSLREAIPVVLHHHERFNGGGYPHGLRGTEIPIGARIVAVADAYHAMVHDRPYKKSLTHAGALAELRRNAGTQFDPEVVRIFCAAYGEGVPADGLEEVYRLHERARGGLERIDAEAAAMVLYNERPDDVTVPKRRRSRRSGAYRGARGARPDARGGGMTFRRGACFLAILTALIAAPSAVLAAPPNTLVAPAATPSAGTTDTSFTLSVQYVSSGGNAASSVSAVVAGRTLPMGLGGGTATNGTWVTSTTLPAGTWPVTFRATASKGPHPTTSGPTVTVVAPVVATPSPIPTRTAAASAESAQGSEPTTPPPAAAPAPPAASSAPASSAAAPAATTLPSANPGVPAASVAPPPGTSPVTTPDTLGAPAVTPNADPASAAPGATSSSGPLAGLTGTPLGDASAAAWAIMIGGLLAVGALALLGAAWLLIGRRRRDDPTPVTVAPGSATAAETTDELLNRRRRGRVSGRPSDDPVLAAMGLDEPRESRPRGGQVHRGAAMRDASRRRPQR